MKLPAYLSLTLALATHALAAPVKITSPTLRGASQPQVAVSTRGNIYATFGKDSTIYATVSQDRGRTFGPPVKVASLPGMGLGMRRGPRIAAAEKTLVISAISIADGNLHGWTSQDNGKTWQATARINDSPKSCREGLHAMASDGKNNLFATWLDLRNDDQAELRAATSADGGRAWSKNQRIYHSPDGHICECCHPSAAMDPQGRVAVMWRNWLGGSRDLYTATSTDFGRTFGSAQKLGTGSWKLEGCPMDGGGIALSGNGEVRTVWRREKTVYTASDSLNEQRLDDSASQPIVAVSGDTVYYLWQKNSSLILQKGTTAPALFAAQADSAAIAALPEGGAVVVWQSADQQGLLAEVLD